MSVRQESAKRRAEKLKQTDPEYYSRIGKIGGSRCVPKGFSMKKELARTVGKRPPFDQPFRTAAEKKRVEPVRAEAMEKRV